MAIGSNRNVRSIPIDDSSYATILNLIQVKYNFANPAKAKRTR